MDIGARGFDEPPNPHPRKPPPQVSSTVPKYKPFKTSELAVE